MSRQFDRYRNQLVEQPATWLITGVAGFVGSHLLEWLLDNGQTVLGVDNFATGSRNNLERVRECMDPRAWARFTFIDGDVRDLSTCRDVVAQTDHVLHQAALGPASLSLADPLGVHDVNTNGFLNMLVAARDAGVSSFTYATSNSVYGDHPVLPRVEERLGHLLSPWAVSKRMNELYAEVFAHCYGFPTIGLRYFNVFGPNQDTRSPHAGVIQAWLEAIRVGDPVRIYGDGSTSRDFCYVANVVQANILAALSPWGVRDRVYNVGVGEQLDLRSLFATLRQLLDKAGIPTRDLVVHEAARPEDVRHSHADIHLIREQLGYEPTHDIQAGLAETVQWYLGN